MAKKLLKISEIILGVLVALIVLALVVFMLIQPVLYKDFYKDAEKEFKTAGLSDGLVPQGMTYLEEQKIFLQCGYMTDGESASRIYVMDKDGASHYVELYQEDGTPYTGHTGGIAAGESILWLANDGDGDDNCVWAIPLQQVLDANTGIITLSERFYPESRSACCYVYDDLLWVGEFYDPEKYPTKESHHLTTDSGEVNPAFICAYAIDETQPGGVMEDTPIKILSVREKLQGFAIREDGRMAISTSYGLANSHIYFYESVLDGEADTTVTVNEAEVPVWYVDSDDLYFDLEAPPMTEEVVLVDDRLYILNESACNKYIFGNFMRARNVYSYPFE